MPARPGYDFIIQGMGGIMDLTGAPDGEPQKIGVAFADIFTGLYAVIAIQAALRHRERDRRRASIIDMALLDTQVGVLANQAMNYLVSGKAPRRLGNAHPNIVPYQVVPGGGRPCRSSPSATTASSATSAPCSAPRSSPTIPLRHQRGPRRATAPRSCR